MDQKENLKLYHPVTKRVAVSISSRRLCDFWEATQSVHTNFRMIPVVSQATQLSTRDILHVSRSLLGNSF